MARSELLDRLRHPLFPRAAEKESQAITLHDGLFRGRKEAPGFTIDDVDTLDMDDGIKMRKKGKGCEVIVSISDVASLVKPDSALDREAFKRAHTVYYPDISSSPMFPQRLSEGLFSLEEKKRRLAITITTPFDERLERGEPIIELTQFTSRQKMSYELANQALENKDNNLHALISEYADLAGGLKAKRKDSSTNRKGTAGTIIEEFMLVANQSIADFLDMNNIPGLYRNHLIPSDASARKALREQIGAMIPDQVDKKTRQSMINQYLNRGTYEPDNQGHYALDFVRYMHGTSPIRRYADVINQRGIHAVLLGEEPLYTNETLEQIGEHLSSVSQKERALASNGVIFQMAGSST
jgi:ribonuclease R